MSVVVDFLNCRGVKRETDLLRRINFIVRLRTRTRHLPFILPPLLLSSSAPLFSFFFLNKVDLKVFDEMTQRTTARRMINCCLLCFLLRQWDDGRGVLMQCRPLLAGGGDLSQSWSLWKHRRLGGSLTAWPYPPSSSPPSSSPLSSSAPLSSRSTHAPPPSVILSPPVLFFHWKALHIDREEYMDAGCFGWRITPRLLLDSPQVRHFCAHSPFHSVSSYCTRIGCACSHHYNVRPLWAD